VSPRSFYLEGRQGALFAAYYPALADQTLGDLLVIPPFGEELNRCRAMVSLQARDLAKRGIGTLVLDPYGTGESEGEFSQGSWELWREDLRRGIEWLRQSGNGCRALWGIRLGAIMAAELAVLDPAIERLLLWQPVVDGKSFFTQFLRIRVAAELERSGGIKTTDELRRMSASGEIIEVSGYGLGQQLVSELDRVRFPPPEQLTRVRLSWFEVLATADAAVPRGSLKTVEACRAAGVQVDLTSVVGPAFWQLHERFLAPDLISATSAAFASEKTAEPSSLRPAQSLREQARSVARQTGAVEYPVVFPCQGESLMGVIHRGIEAGRRGVIIVVAGGPQYRAGAHRQFVQLARKLASAGHSVLRFDLRGMGDSSGEHLGFEHSVPDIRAAIDTLLASEPGVQEVVLFGECESASGILFYAFRDSRVKGIALVNPWVRTEGGRAEVIMKHYYLSRLLSPDFWRKVRSGRFNILESLRSLSATARDYLQGRKLRRQGLAGQDEDISTLPLPVKTAVGLRRFPGPVMILMSGHDYIAREFDEVVKSSQAWRGLLEEARVSRRDVAGADHTFSREVWKRQASDWVCEWLHSF
jgi:exosortase A-associated hydrolase 1/exosortase A-associated hydrolase 2